MAGWWASSSEKTSLTRKPLDCGTVVTTDSGRRVVDGGAVAIRGDTIIAVGTRAQLMNRDAPTGLSVVPVGVTDFDASI
jgi:hypothetical protein